MQKIAKMIFEMAIGYRLPATGKKIIAGAFGLVGFAGTVFANDQRLFAAPPAAQSATPTGAGSMAQATLALALVLIAVFATAYALRRLRKFGAAVSTHGIEIVSQAALGSKERAVLLKVAGAHVLVGVAPGQVNLLHVLDPASIPASTSVTAVADLQNTSNAPSFKSLLKQSLGMK